MEKGSANGPLGDVPTVNAAWVQLQDFQRSVGERAQNSACLLQPLSGRHFPALQDSEPRY